MTWQPLTHSPSVIVVSYSLSMRLFHNRETSQEFLSLLHSACVTRYCELLINGQLRRDGVAEIIAVTELSRGVVVDSAFSVKKKQHNRDFSVVVATVPLQRRGNINAVMNQLSTLRASHGH